MGIAMVNIEQALFVDVDDQVYPIVSWWKDGEECEPDEATVAVAGDELRGRWFTIRLSQFHDTGGMA